MWYRFNDVDNAYAVMDAFRRRMDRLFEDFDYGQGRNAEARPATTSGFTAGWPRTTLTDGGAILTLRAEVPGLSEKDIQVTLNQDVLTISGERRSDAPEGYSVHRQERTPVKFSRSFSLPAKVDLEKVTAVVKNGVLTITLNKAPESQPRQISVQAR